MSIAVVVGNPKPDSRTLAAATWLAGELGEGAEPGLVVDLATLGAHLLDWSGADNPVPGLVEQVAAADVVIAASPTYKAAYTGLLKLFLDRFSPAHGSGLTGAAVPFMLGGSPAHSLAPEHTLRPVLTEIGASVPTRALYVVDAEHDRPEAYAEWLAHAHPLLAPHLSRSSLPSPIGATR